MKASELRIGNLVDYNEGGIFKVIGIHEFGIDCEDEIEIIYMEYENFNPIPLTEEWLLNLGFKEYKDFGYKTGCFDYIKYGFSYLIDTKKIRIMHKGNNMSHILQNKVHYVHQLQNLYFALTGEELTIK